MKIGPECGGPILAATLAGLKHKVLHGGQVGHCFGEHQVQILWGHLVVDAALHGAKGRRGRVHFVGHAMCFLEIVSASPTVDNEGVSMFSGGPFLCVGGRAVLGKTQTYSFSAKSAPTHGRTQRVGDRSTKFTSVVHRHRALAVAPQTHPPEAWQHLVPSLKVLAKRPVCASFRPTRPLALPRGGQDTCAQPASAPFASNGDKPIQWSAMSCIYICSHLCDKTTSFPA